MNLLFNNVTIMKIDTDTNIRLLTLIKRYKHDESGDKLTEYRNN